MGIVPVHSGQPARSMGEALGGHGKRRRNIAPNTGPAGHCLGVKLHDRNRKLFKRILFVFEEMDTRICSK